MKISGGSFGREGSAKLSKDGHLIIKGANQTAEFKRDDVKSLAINDFEGKRFGFFGAPKKLVGVALSENKTVVLECTKKESDSLIDAFPC